MPFSDYVGLLIPPPQMLKDKDILIEEKDDVYYVGIAKRGALTKDPGWSISRIVRVDTTYKIERPLKQDYSYSWDQRSEIFGQGG